MKHTANLDRSTWSGATRGSALVSGVGLGKRVARGSRVGVRLETTRGGEGARAETGGRDGRGRSRVSTFQVGVASREKGHVASFAPFAMNVLSSGGAFDGAVPGRTFEESFTSSTRAASLEGSTTAVATVRASSRCRFARTDEKRAGVLIPESARARLRGSPRCGARARERVAAGTRMAYASVEVIFGRWGREQCSVKAFGTRPMETCERRLARALARFFVFRLFRRRSA